MKLGLWAGLAAAVGAMGASMVSALPLNLPGNLVPDVSATGQASYAGGVLTVNGVPVSLELGLIPGPDFDFDLGGTYSLMADFLNNTGSLTISGTVLDYPVLSTDTPMSLTGTLSNLGFSGSLLEFIFTVNSDTLGIFGSQVGMIMNIAGLQFNPESAFGQTAPLSATSDTFKLPEEPHTPAVPEPLSAGLGLMGLLALAGVASSRRRA